MNKNIKIAKELVRLAKSLVAGNDDNGWDENVIKNFRKEFENDLKDESNKWNKGAKLDNKFPLDDETLKKCLDAFDKLFKNDLMKKSSPGTVNVNNFIDRYREQYRDAPSHCDNLLSDLLNKKEYSRQLGLKG